MSSRLLRPLVVALLLATGARGEPASIGPRHGYGGAVASAEAAATAVGLDTLRAGGNAVDAAVATALALAVVHPEAGNLGGGGFAVVRFEGEIFSLDFREAAPAAATPGMYLDESGEKIPKSSWVGPLATATPGSPYGLWQLHRRFGVLPWKTIVEPSIRLAAGFEVSRRLSARIDLRRDHLARFEETARIWLPGGRSPEPGTTIALPDLRRSLELYATLGPQGLTEGPVAAAIEQAVRRHGGILTAGDLAAYRPVWRQPIRFDAFGWSFATIDLPSSGGILLAQALGLLESLDWDDRPPYGADRVHLLAEVWRRGFADRLLLGEPRTSRASADELLGADWLAKRATEISPTRAGDSSETLPWPGAVPEGSTDTTHVSVADAAGNLVALTTTLNGSFGCGLLVPGAGFLLNNEMDDFTTAPGQPNEFSLVQGIANLVRPDHRMLSSMTPTLAWRGGQTIAIGGRGGSMIPTATLQSLLAVIVDGLNMQDAIDRPRVHHQWLPDRLLVELDTLSPESTAELERRGHTIYVEEDVNQLPKIHAVRTLASGLMEAAADPRGPGVAGVVNPLPD